MTLISLVYANVSIDWINSNGLLLQKLGDVSTYNRSANIIISTPHNEYISQQETIEKFAEEIRMLRNVSKNLSNVNDLDNILFEIDSISQSIKEINHIINGTQKAKAKRSFFPIIGELLEYFFGVSTDTTPNEVWEKFGKATNKQRILSITLFNHSDRAIELINNIQRVSNISEAQMQSVITKLNTLILDTNENFDRVEREIRISKWIQILTLVVIRYKNYQNKVVSYILKQEPSHIDPELLPLSYLHLIFDEIGQKSNGS